jgi:peptidoglycan hydrolase CwlO-like protein
VVRSGTLRRTIRRAIAGPVALVLIAGSGVAARADTRSELADAKRRLGALEQRIASGHARVQAMQDAMRELAADLGESLHQEEIVQAQVANTRVRIEETNARYDALRAKLDEAAADAYRRGPGYGVEAMLGSSSLSDISHVIGYTSAIARHDAELAFEARMLSLELAKRQEQETALLAQRAAVVDKLSAQQERLTEAFAAQQVELAQMASARAEVSALLARLRAKLRAEELAAAQLALRGGMPISFGRWASAFLAAAGKPVVRNNLVVMVAWETAEYTNATWNPLATTYPMSGSTTFNSSGVRNYLSLAQGIEATMRTLAHEGYGYEAILANLAGAADPMTTAQAINDSRWCRGCANGQYVIGLIPAVEQYYDHYAGASA